MEPKVEVVFTNQVRLMTAHLCVNCYPKQQPAYFIWGGHSLCEKCFTPHRQEVDSNKNIHVPGIASRDFGPTWGHEPIVDAEVI
jgi:hypothetical protein